MRWILIAIALAAGWFFFLKPENPDVAARLKCEFAIENFTTHRLGILETSKGTVYSSGGKTNVVIRFERSGAQHEAACVFIGEKTERITLDGKLLAGR